MQLNPEEIASQRIALMGHVEEICEKQGLVPPVEFNVVDVGNQYDLEYSPEYDEVDLPAVPIILPVALTEKKRRASLKVPAIKRSPAREELTLKAKLFLYLSVGV
jgi:hypothetical protein